MPYCCVPFCKSSSKKEKISFHEFPSDATLTGLWLKAISRKDFLPNPHSSSSRVCGKHFEEADFIPNRKNRCLKPGAVPSRFDGYPSYKQPTTVKKRLPVKRKLEADQGNSSVKVCQLVNMPDSSSLTISDEQASLPISLTLDKEIQIAMKDPDSSKQSKEIKRLGKLLRRRESTITLLHRQINKLNEQLNYYKKNECFSNVEKMEVLCGEGEAYEGMEFLLNQVKSFGKKKPRWPESIIRECVLLHAVSPKAYRWLSERKLLKLPSKTTLKRYTGPTSGEVGVTSLIQNRLIEEAKLLRDEEKFCSLVIDEMAIKPQCIYDQKLDQFFGCRSVEQEEDNWRTDLYLQADKLLCFVLYGLCLDYIQVPGIWLVIEIRS